MSDVKAATDPDTWNTAVDALADALTAGGLVDDPDPAAEYAMVWLHAEGWTLVRSDGT